MFSKKNVFFYSVFFPHDFCHHNKKTLVDCVKKQGDWWK